MKYPHTIALLALRWLAFGYPAMCSVACGARIAAVPTVCGTIPNNATCMGAISAPEERLDVFVEAAGAAIDIVHSKRLEADLSDFIAHHAQDGELRDSWAGANATQIVTKLRLAIQGAQVATFGGARGAYDSIRYGTVAIERTGDEQPIEINRWGTKGLTSPQIANTIVHEIAHAIGLRHPHMGGPASKNWDVARCEPPYLIGSLVERIAAGDKWKWSPGHCASLREPEATQIAWRDAVYSLTTVCGPAPRHRQGVNAALARLYRRWILAPP